MSDFLNSLGSVEPAPFNAHSGRLMDSHTMLRFALLTVLRFCLAQKPFTAAMILEAVPELASVYHSPNALGTALGGGVHRKGLRLWRAPNGTIAPSFENAVIAVRAMSAPEREALPAQLGFTDLQALAVAIKTLPRVAVTANPTTTN